MFNALQWFSQHLMRCEILASKKPLTRLCHGCGLPAYAPPSASYGASGTQRALMGPHTALASVFVVVARGHCLLYASAAQHDIDRNRVLRRGVLHLHGAVVRRISRGVYQIQTPDDAGIYLSNIYLVL